MNHVNVKVTIEVQVGGPNTAIQTVATSSGSPAVEKIDEAVAEAARRARCAIEPAA